MKTNLFTTKAMLIALVILVSSLQSNAQEYFNSSTFGDTFYDQVFGSCMDFNESTYIVGQYSGTITVGDSTVTYKGGNVDAYLAKYDRLGEPLWVLSFGNLSDASASAVTTDTEGNIYLTGYFQGSGVNSLDADPGPGEYLLSVPSALNSRDAFIIKLDSAGSFIWAKQISNPVGAAPEDTYAIAVDSENNIYVGGRFIYANFDTNNPNAAAIMAEGSNFDGFLVKLNNEGNTIWSKTFKSPDNCTVRSLSIDSNDNIYVAGEFAASIKLNPDNDVMISQSNGLSDAFMVKVNGQGNYIWGSTFGGEGPDQPEVIETINNDIYIGGYFSSTVDMNPDVNETDTFVCNGGVDAFVSKFDQGGDFVFSYQMGSNTVDLEKVKSISEDTEGLITITGNYSDLVDFDMGPEESVSTSNGGLDHFLLQIDTNGTYVRHISLGSIENEGSCFAEINLDNEIIISGSFASSINLNVFGPEEDLASSAGFYDVYVSRFTFSDTSNTNVNYVKNSINNIVIYPTPTKDFFKIRSQQEISSISVYSMEGKLLLQEKQPANKKISIENLDKGIYYIKVETEDLKIFSRKIIKI